jgi:hypothetical protein
VNVSIPLRRGNKIIIGGRMREGPEWEKGMEKGLQNQAWGKQERSLECQENEWKYSAVGCWEQKKKKKKKKKEGGPGEALGTTGKGKRAQSPARVPVLCAGGRRH